MRITIFTRLFLSFFFVFLAMTLIGYIAFKDIGHVMESFARGEQHYSSIVDAVTEAASYAKRAEGHLLMYLSLHDVADRTKFFSRCASLDTQLHILDSTLQDPGARAKLSLIRQRADEIPVLGQRLLQAYDSDMSAGRIFHAEEYRDLFRAFFATTSAVRELSVDLAKYEVALESNIKSAALQEAQRFRTSLLLLGICLCLAVFVLSLANARSISRPIEALERMAHEIRNGNLSARTNVASNDEIGVLARALNEMTAHLQSSEQHLREDEERHRTIIHAAMAGFWLADVKGRLLEVNDAYCRMSGYTAEELLTLRIPDLVEVETADDVAARIRKILTQGEDRFESRHRRKDGSIFDVEVSVQYRPEDGGQLVAFLQDITERKRAADQLQRNLEEKQVLLREVHHRVKNNLTVISSLLNLQSSAIQTPEQAIAAFQNSRDRIMAMSLVHNELYGSENYSRVDMTEYIKNLSRHMLQAYGSRGNIRLNAQAADVILRVDTSIPCGLILNELITNAFKHAFPDGRAGEIHVLFATVDDNFLELSVSDDGIGLPAGYADGETLGLSLVRLLTEQLDATLTVSTERGTRFRIRLPKERNQTSPENVRL
jgi:PAS domain S-box-containing protein